ncbi:MAG: hypothetical protein DHS20C15_02590 [Planctomycetota bacterium]|nr:MAG: hypothetical protein DHS20C15_02590 [Planctomycetota bacterium]
MEIMAAVFMLGVLLLPLLTIKERATSRVERAHARLVALGHAEDMLSLARRDPKEHLEAEGRVDGDEWYRYEFTLEDWDTSTSFADTEDDEAESGLFDDNSPLDAGIPPTGEEEETDPHKVRRFQIEIFWPDFERPDVEDSIRLDGFLPRVAEERGAVFNR